jgi:hypothetical protein
VDALLDQERTNVRRRWLCDSRIGIDYQLKNRVTANDDQLNSRLQVSWNVEK